MAAKFFDTVEDNETGKPVAGATVLVYVDGATLNDAETQVTSGTLATIYSDDGSTTINQSTDPITTDSSGYFDFYTNETEVALEISYGGSPKKAIDDVSIVGGTVNSDVTALGARVDNHDTLLGYAANTTDLGTFSGSTISDNNDIQGALQELETAVEASGDGDMLAANNLSDVGNAATSRSNLSAAAQSQPTETISFLIETPSDKDYRLIANAPHGGTITEMTTVCASGTCTVTGKINSTALGGTANSASSTEQSQSHSSDNVMSAGDDFVLTISSNSSCADLTVTVQYTRSLA